MSANFWFWMLLVVGSVCMGCLIDIAITVRKIAKKSGVDVDG